MKNIRKKKKLPGARIFGHLLVCVFRAWTDGHAHLTLFLPPSKKRIIFPFWVVLYVVFIFEKNQNDTLVLLARPWTHSELHSLMEPFEHCTTAMHSPLPEKRKPLSLSVYFYETEVDMLKR
jgi:hypothetical protein